MTKTAKKKPKPKPKPPPPEPVPSGVPDELPAEFTILEADAENDFQLIEAQGDGGGDAAASGDAAKKLRRFAMTAYTGGRLTLPGFPFPVVVDLSGLKVSAKSRPILRDHNAAQIVGHTEAIDNNGGSIRLKGVISAANEFAREVSDSADNGFPWQASIGAAAQRMVFVDRGENVEVNGRRFTGPLYVARQAALREVSFVALGADDQTSARMADRSLGAAGTHTSTTIKVNDMKFEEWLQARGFQADELSDKQTESLRAMYERENSPADADPPTEEPVAPPEADPAPAENVVPPNGSTVNAQAVIDQYTQSLRAAHAAELRRIERIREICGSEYPKIEAQAIEEGWDTMRTELKVLRESRPKVPVIHAGPGVSDARILEAAACLSAGIAEDELVRDYGDPILSAAYPMRNIGLKELVAECARCEGIDIPRIFGDGKLTIRAGFSTISLPGILENVMNKTLLASYQTTPIAALQLCAVGSVSDFKEVSRYRLLGTGRFEKVPPSGELKSGRLDEQKFTNKAETYGQILYLTRNDVLNDDLNAFLDIYRQIGRSGAELIDDLFFTLLLSNPNSFFSVANSNYLTGAATAFGSDSLTQAKTLFRKQKAGPGTAAKDQKPINVRPRLLVVPVEIETDAEVLMGSAQLLLDGATAETKIPVDNPHRNKYDLQSFPHLSDTYYGGSSTKAWYLFADPRVLPAFELVFLNGKRTPVVERIDAPPNVLGLGFRSYIDVGVKEQDPKGALKVKGEA